VSQLGLQHDTRRRETEYIKRPQNVQNTKICCGSFWTEFNCDRGQYIYFPVVIFGSNVADKFSEISIITSRIVLTNVYLHHWLFPLFISHDDRGNRRTSEQTTFHFAPLFTPLHHNILQPLQEFQTWFIQKADITSRVRFSSNGCTQTLSRTYHT
jgi:hypothetical protein